MRAYMLLLSAMLSVNLIYAQTTSPDINNIQQLLHSPLQYTVLRTTEKMKIDGRDNEKAWTKAPWTKLFSDIVSGEAYKGPNETQCKLLWDDNYLYVYAQLKESDIWASITEHDRPVYQGNAFEMFIDPDGDTHDYVEFQINAYVTVCDIFLPKPYRNGGHPLGSWDIKGLKKAISINGTLNNPGDTDKSWSIELAIPFKSVSMNRRQHPAIGTIWRMNFSRVEWDANIINGKYVRKRDSTGKLLAEHYLVWSPQGVVNLHYPERWGYVMFSDHLTSSGFLSAKREKLKLLLWKYYYLQQYFKSKNGHYAHTITQLNKTYSIASAPENTKLQMEATNHQFWIQCFFPSLNAYLSVDQEGQVRHEKDTQDE